MIKKQIANLITGSRILFSLLLLFIPLSSAWFYILYLFCGFTDMIDGAMARKMGSVSPLGARLDTASDFLFLLVCLIKILPLLKIPAWLWGWIIVISLIKIGNILFVFLQKKKLLSIHSVFNKITGFSLFLFPLSLFFWKSTYSIVIVCVTASVAAIQEVCLIVKGKEVL